MAFYHTLPRLLASVSPRFRTPVPVSVLTGFLLIALTWVYLLATSVQNAFNAVVNVSGLLFAAFYILTALATIVYYRRRALASVRNALELAIGPLAAAGFLGWIIYRSTQQAPAAQNWSLAGIIALGLLLMLVARYVFRSPFFAIRRENERVTEVPMAVSSG